MNDTPPSVKKIVQEMMRTKSILERIHMASSMYACSRNLVLSAILRDKGELLEKNLRVEFFLKFYGSDFDHPSREAITIYLKEKECLPFDYLKKRPVF